MHGPEHVVEFFHGYTYSAHPLACAAGLAALDLYRDEDLFARCKKIEPLWYDAAMTLKEVPRVLDIRCVGLTAGIDLASRPGDVGKRAYDAMETAFNAESLVIRVTGETIALTPPLIVSEREIEDIFAKVARVIRAVA
jgi:beta-alanine--pyruvate transaminase